MSKHTGLGTGFLRGGRWVLMRRVPKRFQHLDPRGMVRIALRTDSEAEARAKAPAVAAELDAYWEALAAGDQSGAAGCYAAAVDIAQTRGFRYRPIAAIATGDYAELLDRVKALESHGRVMPDPEIEAILGRVEAPQPRLSAVLEDFFVLTRDRLKGKSPDQVKRWQDARRKTIANMIEVFGDKPIAEVTRADAVAFREWWQDRVSAGHAANTANKQFGQASDIFNTVNELRGYGLASPFGRLRLKDLGHGKRDPFSPNWIRQRLLAPGALDGLNQAARDVLLAMINTGAGPNEIIGLEPEDFRLDHEVPHIRLRANGIRQLKTGDRPREIPAVGVSLGALQRLADAGGCAAYHGRNDIWSATVNKYLRAHGLFENDRQTAYSLRHGFEDRLLDAGVDDRIRADLMGHKYARPKYGAGGRLSTVATEVAKVAI